MVSVHWTPLRMALRGLAAFGITLASHLAQAQTAYTVQELKNPGSNRKCTIASPDSSGTLLNATGDVVGFCDYVAGLGISYYPLGVGITTYLKPVIWRNGGAGKLLDVAANSRTHPINAGLRITDAGDVYGGMATYAFNLLTFKVPPDKAVMWKGTKQYPWVPPSPLTGNWEIDAVSHGGALLLYHNPPWDPVKGQAPSEGSATVVAGRITRLPPAPYDRSVQDEFYGWPQAINDKGQVLMGHLFWNGTQWVQVQGPQGAKLRWTDGLNNKGEVTGGLVMPWPLYPDQAYDDVYERAKGTRFIWSESGGAVSLPGAQAYRSEGRSAMSDKGQVVGALADVQGASVYPRAAIWHPGQAAIDLNTLVTLPKDVTLQYAVAINAKGQILAQQGTTFLPRYFLLTPK